MSTDPAPSASARFRTAAVTTPSTPVERLAALHDQPEQLYDAFRQLADAAAREHDPEALLALARAAGATSDPHAALAVRRHAAQLLIAVSNSLPHGEDWAWATWLDMVVELLVEPLEQHPHEPDLVNLLGFAVYELGHTPVARRLFEAIREVDPEHAQARSNLRACKERMQRAGVVTPVPDAHCPRFTASRTRVKRVAERVVRVPDRTISLCMIVRDEEEMLPGCLAAAARWVDQVVVVDTGSTDRTREIAAEHGALVVDFAWTGSFSDARNESLRHATGDWVLWLDADEHLVDQDGRHLRALARMTWVEGFRILETHYTGDSDFGSQATHTPMRLFRRRPAYRFEGTVHEQVMSAFPTWLPERFRQSPMRVDHFGYLKQVVDERDKRERNLTLLLAQVEQGRDAFACFNIGTEYAAMSDWPRAHPWFEEALEHARRDQGWQHQQFSTMLVQRAMVARRSIADHAGALELAEEALGWWPDYTDLVFEQGLVHAQVGDWEQVESAARRALELGDAPASYVASRGRGSFQARALLARALRHRGELDAARVELERAVDEAPDFLQNVVDLADLLLHVQVDAAEVSHRIDELLGDRAATTAASMLLGASFHEAGALEQAEERYERILAAHPTHGMALVAMSELRLAQERPREAWEFGTSVDALDRMAGRGARSAFLAAVVLDEPELLVVPAARIAQAQELPAPERAVYVAWRERVAPSAGTVRAIIPIDQVAADVVFANLEALARLEATEAFEQLYPLAAQVVPDERERRMRFADLYLRRRFADMAGEELLACVQRFGPDAAALTGLGKVATIKEMWEDAEVFLAESLQLDPRQPDAARLLDAVRARSTG